MKIHLGYTDCPCSQAKSIGLFTAINNYLAKQLYEHKEMTLLDIVGHFGLITHTLFPNKYENPYKGQCAIEKKEIERLVKQYTKGLVL